jgi:hypothetical protein
MCRAIEWTTPAILLGERGVVEFFVLGKGIGVNIDTIRRKAAIIALVGWVDGQGDRF